ncbi:MAG: ribosome biogenesis GTP-binding protein YihA/YsxC [Alphaproteobacteria bacterium]
MSESIDTIEFSDEELEKARLLFARGTKFTKGVVAMSGLPSMELPEVAFAGRSNVGKSSLINALTNTKGLARASNTPGRTRELNYFLVGDDELNLVDMPGYGYAKASKTDIEKWNALIRKYLRGRANLRRVFILIDSRHGLKPNDFELMDMLDEAAVTYQIVLTKTDKIKKSDIEKVYKQTQDSIKKRAASFPFAVITSSEKKSGIDILRTYILHSIQM